MLNFIFYLISGLLVLSASSVLVTRKPVYSVLFLVLSFVLTSSLMIMLAAEFMAMFLIVIYVGAIAVLFLFIVMMLDFNIIKKSNPWYYNLPVLVFLCLVAGGLVYSVMSVDSSNEVHYFTLQEIAGGLYLQNMVEFQVAGLVLLASMVTVIVVVLEKKNAFIRSQNVISQVTRKPADCLEVKKVHFDEGIDI